MRYFKISKKSEETASIRSFSLVNPLVDMPLPEFSAGAHITVHAPETISRQYSLANTPGSSDHYLNSILRGQEGRGGSHWIHESLRSGIL